MSLSKRQKRLLTQAIKESKAYDPKQPIPLLTPALYKLWRLSQTKEGSAARAE